MYTPKLHTSDNSQNYPSNNPYLTQEFIRNKHEPLHDFAWQKIPRQVYLYVLLGLPILYSTRVTKLIKEVEAHSLEIKKATQTMPEHTINQCRVSSTTFDPSIMLPMNLEHTWESFIDLLMREYKTFNLISVLLLSFVLSACFYLNKSLPCFPQCHPCHSSDRKCSWQSAHSLLSFTFSDMCTYQFSLRLYIHYSVWKHA